MRLLSIDSDAPNSCDGHVEHSALRISAARENRPGGAIQRAIEQSKGYGDIIGEDSGPIPERDIGGDDDRVALVA